MLMDDTATIDVLCCLFYSGEAIKVDRGKVKGATNGGEGKG